MSESSLEFWCSLGLGCAAYVPDALCYGTAPNTAESSNPTQRCVHPAKTQEHAGMTLVMIDEMDALLQRSSGGQVRVLCRFQSMWVPRLVKLG